MFEWGGNEFYSFLDYWVMIDVVGGWFKIVNWVFFWLGMFCFIGWCKTFFIKFI